MSIGNIFKVICIFTMLLFPLQACGDSSVEGTDGSDIPTAEALGLEEILAEAPSFTLKDTEGRDVSLEDFRGQYVLLNFWATWCPPCVKEMPALEEVHNKFSGKGLKVVAINDYESPKKAINYVKDGGYTFLVLTDPPGKTSEAYKAMVLPMTFIIDPEGRAIARAVGYRDWAGEGYIKYLEELIKQ